MTNLEIFTKEYETLKGQFVLVDTEAIRLIGIAEDEIDYYYVLYNGRTLRLTSCVMRLTPLKGFILDDHYNDMVRMSKLNHYDQVTLWGSKDDELIGFNEKHKEELINGWNDTKFILGPHWDLN
jgi:hypothetical protein